VSDAAVATRRVALTVNGTRVEVDVEPRTTLLSLLRDTLALTGTRQGCDTVQCGACTVLVDGDAAKACNLLAVQVDGARVDTIEGLAAPDGTLHPMQRAFGEHHALQCGYCTPGMVMRGVAMAGEDVPAEPHAVREALCGNLCRCTGYRGIVGAICEGVSIMRAGPTR
jgi:carbon-monoxide dehydrogenase small subunit